MTDPEKLYPELVFQTARSGGAGGQNVNKVETKVELRFDIAGSAVLTEEQKEKLYVRLASKLTNEKVLVLYHQTERSQLANKEKVIVKFYELIKKAFTDPKKRRPTRPTLASKKNDWKVNKENPKQRPQDEKLLTDMRAIWLEAAGPCYPNIFYRLKTVQMIPIAPPTTALRALLSLPVIVASLGYFVDVYDLLLFNVVRVPSLVDLGLSEAQVSTIGARVYNWQQAGLLIGGFFWGILGDKLGRRSVLFGSIIMYSVANIVCGFVTSVDMYAFLRFFAGLGLAGELGAGITLIAEILPRQYRGYGASMVAGVGLLGAVAAFFTVKLTDWRTAYFIGGGMGIALLAMRVNVLESVLFTKTLQNGTKSLHWLTIFTNRTRLFRYLRCMGIALPTYLIIGIFATFGNEFANALGIPDVQAGACVLYTYLGVVSGDFFSGMLSQWLRSRRKAIFIMMLMTLCGVGWLLFGGIDSPSTLYICYGWLGFSIGYIAMFLTTTAEQFGTNLRATVTTSVANNVRATTLLTLPFFQMLKPEMGTLQAGAVVGGLCFLLAIISLWKMEETYGKDLDYVEV